MGTLEVICGPMFSGKTEELIRRVTRAVIARRKVQVFKPRLDSRYDPDAVVSHSQWRVVSTVVDTAPQILEQLDPAAEVVGIDEVQFLGPQAVEVCRALVERGLRVIVAGLDQDYRGAPFEPMPQLLAEAEYVTKELAICMVCGAPAGRSQRIVPADDRVVVGAAETYEPRCRKCFSPEPRPATAPAEQELFPFVKRAGPQGS
ncbi:MAG TPA: thymidine kinase [Myxococcales bacterium]